MEPPPRIGASLTSPFLDTHRHPRPIGALPFWLSTDVLGSEESKRHRSCICMWCSMVVLTILKRPFESIQTAVPRMVTGQRLTLGAKLTILPHPFIRKSALTTPPRRVPNISRLLFRSTAALSSNRTTRPSGRRTGFRHRTMTARRTSPRRTFKTLETACAPGDMGRARFTTQTISSPTPPQPLLTLFLRTLTHSTRRAPELSMTCFLLSTQGHEEGK